MHKTWGESKCVLMVMQNEPNCGQNPAHAVGRTHCRHLHSNFINDVRLVSASLPGGMWRHRGVLGTDSLAGERCKCVF